MKYNEFKPLTYNFLPANHLTIEPYNGIAIIVYTNGTDQHVYNLNGERLALLSNFKQIDFLSLSTTDTWYAYAGVFINKKKLGNIVYNDHPKFIILDVLVWDGECVINVPMKQREAIYLDRIMGLPYPNTGKEWIYNMILQTPFKGIFKQK